MASCWPDADQFPVLCVCACVVRLQVDSREWESGCTAAAMIVRGRKLFTAHLGDTRAVIARGPMAVDLTKDHTPEVGLCPSLPPSLPPSPHSKTNTRVYALHCAHTRGTKTPQTAPRRAHASGFPHQLRPLPRRCVGALAPIAPLVAPIAHPFMVSCGLRDMCLRVCQTERERVEAAGGWITTASTVSPTHPTSFALWPPSACSCAVCSLCVVRYPLLISVCPGSSSRMCVRAPVPSPQEIELGLHKLKSMHLEDPIIRKYAEAAVKWQSVSRVNSDLGAWRAHVCMSFPGPPPSCPLRAPILVSSVPSDLAPLPHCPLPLWPPFISGVARAIGDADFKLGVRMSRFPWNFPKGIPREFTADIVNGEPDVGEVRVRVWKHE
jgi:hypothetical protein